MGDHHTMSLSSLSYVIIAPISFSHAAHADQVKRDFLGSASNSVIFFFSTVWDSLYLPAMGVLLAWGCVIINPS